MHILRQSTIIITLSYIIIITQHELPNMYTIQSKDLSTNFPKQLG